MTSVGGGGGRGGEGVPVSATMPARTVDGVIRPIPLASEVEDRFVEDLQSYLIAAVHRLTNLIC